MQKHPESPKLVTGPDRTMKSLICRKIAGLGAVKRLQGLTRKQPLQSTEKIFRKQNIPASKRYAPRHKLSVQTDNTSHSASIERALPGPGCVQP